MPLSEVILANVFPGPATFGGRNKGQGMGGSEAREYWGGSRVSFPPFSFLSGLSRGEAALPARQAYGLPPSHCEHRGWLPHPRRRDGDAGPRRNSRRRIPVFGGEEFATANSGHRGDGEFRSRGGGGARVPTSLVTADRACRGGGRGAESNGARGRAAVRGVRGPARARDHARDR